MQNFQEKKSYFGNVEASRKFSMSMKIVKIAKYNGRSFYLNYLPKYVKSISVLAMLNPERVQSCFPLISF